MFVIPSCKVRISQAIEIMKHLGMSIKEFAEDLGVAPITIQGWLIRVEMDHEGYINRHDLNTILISHMINLNAREAAKEQVHEH